jgi:hypothetical protein
MAPKQSSLEKDQVNLAQKRFIGSDKGVNLTETFWCKLTQPCL